ncbi:MAG: M20 family metallopeptidase [Thermaerobacter sp.]|nr:M20 family metallopeptidase [Thermaerobacter sp.]
MVRRPASDDMRARLETLVNIESPSGDVEGVRGVVDFVAEQLADIGKVRMDATKRGPILTVSRGQGGALLLGHSDTVWPKGTLKDMPYKDEGDWVYGPGTLDMKGGLVLAIEALRMLDGDTPFTLLVTPDEEVGSEMSRESIEREARLAPLVLVLEPGMPAGAIKVGRAGVGDFRLTITGIESHAGLDPDKGASAIKELAHQVLWLHGLENKVVSTTVNVGVVEGGTRSNVTAGRVEGRIDVRVATAAEMERIKKTLKAPPRFDSRCQVRYQGGFNRPPMEPNAKSQEWINQAGEIWQSLTGESLVGVRVGGASDGNYTARLTPTLDGLGPVGQGAHARTEGIEWRFMEPRATLIAQLVARAGTQ